MGGLTVGLTKGGAVYINDTKVTVHKITHSLSFQVKVHTPAVDKIFSVDDRRATEIMQGVMCSAGNKGSSDMVKMVIDAPRHMKILREKLYLKARKDAALHR